LELHYTTSAREFALSVRRSKYREKIRWPRRFMNNGYEEKQKILITGNTVAI